MILAFKILLVCVYADLLLYLLLNYIYIFAIVYVNIKINKPE